MSEKNDEVKAAAENLVPKPDRPKGPSKEAIEAAQRVLREAHLASLPPDFGPGLKGKIKWKIPEIPSHLGYPTVHQAVPIRNADGTHKKDDKGTLLYSYPTIHYKPGTEHEVTFDEMREIEFKLSRLVHNENVGKYGEGRAKRVEMNLNVGQQNSIMNGRPGSEMY